MNGNGEIIGPGGSVLDNAIGLDGNSLDVNIKDQTTAPIDLFFAQSKGLATSLTVATAEDDTQIEVDDATLMTPGSYIGIFSGISGESHFYFGTVLSALGDIVQLDTPLDFAFDIGDPVISTTRELNVDGSVVSEIFSIAVSEATVLIVDVTRIFFQAFCASAVDLEKFGDITGGLVKGLVIRRNNGVMNNIYNIKTNGDFDLLTGDYKPYDSSKPNEGVNGFSARSTFAGQDKHGVAIRLFPGDTLEAIIQDNLSTLSQFRIVAQGHLVDVPKGL